MKNKKDPLRNLGPESERELFNQLSNICDGFPRSVILPAVMNLLVNVVRQASPFRNRAITKFDELTSQAKTLLLEHHYDKLGRRRNIFPYQQIIGAKHFDARIGRKTK